LARRQPRVISARTQAGHRTALQLSGVLSDLATSYRHCAVTR
jgi:hypothetical protein